MMTGSRLLVCVSSAGVSAALWRGRITNYWEYAADQDGEEDFAEMLAAIGTAPVYLIVDSVEEDYRFETLPHALGADRRAMVARKLRQLYRSTPFMAARLLGREAGNRRDDRYLFTALTDVEIIEPWIAAVESRGLPIAGVFAVPTVTPAVLKPLRLRAGKLLAVSKHSAGLRQTFLENGHFRFSRLTPFRGVHTEAHDSTFASEIANTRLYLNALQATSTDEIVDVVLLDHDDSLEGLYRAVLANPEGIRVRRIARDDIVDQLKLAPELLASKDALHLHLLSRFIPVENLAPASLRQRFRIHQASRVVYVAAAAAALVAGAWLLLDMHRSASIEREASEAALETSRYQTMYAELTREFPASPVSATVLKQTVDAFDRLRETARTPETLFRDVSQALASQPALRLNGIEWRFARFTDIGNAFNGTGGQFVPRGTPRRQAGRILGEVHPFSGDYRQAIGTIREFADELRRVPGVTETRIVKLPLDDSSKQSLSGTTSTQTRAAVGAQFEIIVGFREVGAR
ncbi:MAG: hypothetical protein GC151_06655 [Betaproteobacteria bacterium]|nr:hypothetical protein [Betaproteobacteria bacterium]